MSVDYSRALVAYKVGAEGGHAGCQWQAGFMYCNGRGVAVDYQQARAWIEKAAAQDLPNAVCALGVMYEQGKGVTPSFRRARELYQRAIELGDSPSVKNMQTLTQSIQNVSRARPPASFIISHTASRHSYSLPPSLPRTHRSPPSWTSGWRSTARAAPT